MIEIKRLISCPLEDVIEAWNSGFKGYFTDMTMSVDRFLQRMVQEGLSAEDSVIAYVNGVPAGIVLNGFRTIDGKTIGYNGGTGVAPEYRRTGIGKQMMESVMEIYKKRDVDIATLEAISENTGAIKLYESLGYEVNDHVEFIQQDGRLQANFEDFALDHQYQFEWNSPENVSHLPFYHQGGPWQTQWQSVVHGEAMIVSYEGRQVGYTLSKRNLKSDGCLASIVLYQLGVHPDFHDLVTLVDTMLYKSLEPQEACKRLVINLSREAKPQYEAVKNRGFSTMVQQVCMRKVIKESTKVNAESIKKI